MHKTVQEKVEDIKEQDHPIQHTGKNELVAETVQAVVEDIKEQDHPIQHTGKSEIFAETVQAVVGHYRTGSPNSTHR